MNMSAFLRSLYWIVVSASIIGWVAVIWQTNNMPKGDSFTYTEDGYKCTVLISTGIATCKDKE